MIDLITNFKTANPNLRPISSRITFLGIFVAVSFFLSGTIRLDKKNGENAEIAVSELIFGFGDQFMICFFKREYLAIRMR